MDNAQGRRALDDAGFDFVVEAGLGRGHQDFRTLLLHTLPGKQRAAEIWRDGGQNKSPQEAAAYRRLLAEGTRPVRRHAAGRQGGWRLSSGLSPPALVLAEVLRRLHGGRMHLLVEVTW